MHRSKAEVDKHVESLVAKLSLKEFKSRAYSIARLYYDAGDYASCRRYVEQFLSVRESDAAAHKLLGHAQHKLGEKEKALEQYKTSLDMDPTQTTLILDICELLSDDEVYIDVARARYWCEQAETKFPRNQATFNLRERLLKQTDSDPAALLRLLQDELQQRPRDTSLHARLLKQHLNTNNYKDAFDHSFQTEFGDNDSLRNSSAWYEVLSEVLSLDRAGKVAGEWRHRLLELTVAEKLCSLSISDGPGSPCKSLVESAAALHRYDRELHRVCLVGPGTSGAEFHSALLHHHRGQFSFYAACFLLKKAKKDQLSWREALRPSSPLFLSAWHCTPIDLNASWLTHAPEQQKSAAKRWHLEASYRCSQAGHCLLAGVQEKSHSFIDRVSQFCSGTHWKDKVYEKLFTNKDRQSQNNSSHFLSDHFQNPTLTLPRRNDVQKYDVDGQKMFPNSLHHVVWMLIDYKNYSQFKCVLFDTLRPTCQNYPNCGPETLSRLDVEAFLYAAALTAAQHRKHAKQSSYQPAEVPELLPADISDLLCSLPQMKWWDCAHRVSQSEVGLDLSDVRATLRRGIEVVRCIDNHGLDPQLLCKLAAIFSARAKLSTERADEKENLNARAALYYSAAIPLLERLKSKMMTRLPDKRMFEFTHKDLSSKEISILIEESKQYMGETYMNEREYEKANDVLNGLKSARSSHLLSQIHTKMAFDEISSSKERLTSEDRSKHVILLSKAKEWAYVTIERLKCSKDDKLYAETQKQLETIENAMSHVDLDSSNLNDYDSKYSSDENASSGDSHIEHVPMRASNSMFRNVSSTPKHRSNSNATHYKSAMESHILDGSRTDRKHLERIESQIKSLHKKDCSMNSFMEQTKTWIEENRHLGEEVRGLKNNLADKIISNINTNIQDTVDQFKLLKLSVDQVKDKIGEYRNECRTDVGDLKKEVAELKKEVSRLKQSNAEQALDESDLYNLEDYHASETAPSLNVGLPFTASQVLPPFNQRLVPPVALPPAAYSLYGQNLYSLYNQFSQLAQAPPVPPAPLFDPARPPLFPPTDQMYSDVPHFHAPPVVPQAPPVSRPAPIVQNKEVSKSLPVNVVITSSDPVPTRTSAPQPVFSVTIPPQHIKNSPHNYQIPLPNTGANPLGIFSVGNVATAVSTPKPFAGWNQTSTFSTTPTLASNSSPKVSSTFDNSKFNLFDTSKTGDAVDSPKTNFSGLSTSFASPNVSANKSRTLSERSNTSVENYDPCPDFKPIIPLPAEVQVTTGEENETTIFSARAKLYRYVDKQWKERGLGELKLLKHKVTGKVRVVMRREQIHKICANHIITPEMNLQLMKNETKAYVWVANDYADETVVLEKFCVRFKTVDIAKEFYDIFEKARKEIKTTDIKLKAQLNQKERKTKSSTADSTTSKPSLEKPVLGGFTFSGTPAFKPSQEPEKKDEKTEEKAKPNLFGGLNFKTQASSPFANIFSTTSVTNEVVAAPVSKDTSGHLNTSDVVEEFEPSVDFKPVVPLPELVEQKTGEEDEIVAFEHRAKLLRFDAASKEWKERGLGNIKILVNKKNDQKVRLLMRREIVMKVCCNHGITKDLKFEKMPNQDKAITWCAKDFSEGELTAETFCLRFKTALICDDFIAAIKEVQSKLRLSDFQPAKVESGASKNKGFGDKFKPKAGSWSCPACYTNNTQTAVKCIACEQPKELRATAEKPKSDESNLPLPVANWGDKFKPKAGSWECTQCLIRNDAVLEYCSACESPKDPSKPKKETKSILDVPGAPVFTFGIPKSAETNKAQAAPVATFGTNTQQTAPTVAFGSNVQQAAPVTFGITNQNKPGAFTFSPASSLKTGPFGVTPPTTESISNAVPFGQVTKSATASSNASPFSTPSKDSLTNVSFAKQGGTFDFVMKPKTGKGKSPHKSPQSDRGDGSDDDNYEEDEGHHIHFAPIIPLPDKVEVTTGEENEIELYSHRAKLFRFVSGEWKERGIGNVKILKHKDSGKLRVLMRREQIHKICLNHVLTPEIMYSSKDDRTWLFTANDFSEGELQFQQFCLRFKNKEIAADFKKAADDARGDTTATVEKKTQASLKRADLDDVIFVKEILATPEEKQRAKALMLPENFFTYQTKEPCPGCRGCERDEDSAFPPPAPQNLTLTTPSKNAFSVSPTNSIFTTPMAFNNSSDLTIFQTPMGASDNDKSWSSENKNTSTDKENSTPNTKKIGAPANSTAFSFFKNALSENPNIEVTASTKTPLLATPKLNAVKLGEAQQGTEPKILFGQQKPEVKSIFGVSSDQKPAFGSLFNQKSDNKSIFGSAGEPNPKSLFGTTAIQTTDTKSLSGSTKVQNSEAKSTFPTVGSLFSVPANQNAESKSIFGSDKNQATKPLFGSTNEPVKFGTTTEHKPEVKSIFGFGSEQKLEAKSMFGSTNEPKSMFGSLSDQKPIFGEIDPKSVFGSAANQKAEVKSYFGAATAQNPEVKSVGSTTEQKPETISIFGSTDEQKMEAKSIFGFGNAKPNTDARPLFGNIATDGKPLFGSAQNSGSIFGGTGINAFGLKAASNSTPVLGTAAIATEDGQTENNAEPLPFSADSGLSFAALSTSNGLGIAANKNENFQWEGAGAKLFVSKGDADSPKPDKEKEKEEGTEEEYDPHYEPIVPLPDKIEVTTGEEDEDKMFGERAKLFRYDDKSREWKERGVGEIKLLYHPARKTYRLLLRREQVHKLVLNTLLHKDLELLPMKNSDTAWTWPAINYAEAAAGEQETLAVRLKNVVLATAFKNAVVDAVRKLQVADAVAYRERHEASTAPASNIAVVAPTPSSVFSAPTTKSIFSANTSASIFSLPNTASIFSAPTSASIFSTPTPSSIFATPTVASIFPATTAASIFGTPNPASIFSVPSSATISSVVGAAPATVTDVDAQVEEHEDEEYAHDYEDYDDEYEDYYNEEDEQATVVAEAAGAALVACPGSGENIQCDSAALQVLFDQDMYAHKLMLTDGATGEILSDFMLLPEVSFELSGDTAVWSGVDYTTGDEMDKTVTFTFANEDEAANFRDAVEVSADATVLAVVLLQLCAPQRSEGVGWGEPRQHDYHTPLDVRAVLVNCDKKPNISWGRATLSQFEKEEFYRHNVLKDCHKKIALTLRLEANNDQVSGDEYVWVESVFDAQSAGTVPLLNPYVVKLCQEPVLQAYNLTFVTTVEANLNKNIDISLRKDVPSDHPQMISCNAAQKEGTKRVKRTIILDGRDPQHSSFSVKMGEVKEEYVAAPPPATQHHTITTENINDCGLDVCTEPERKGKVTEAETHDKHHRLTHHPHSRPNAPHHHTTSSHPPHPTPPSQAPPHTTARNTQHTTLDDKHKHARSEATAHTVKANPIIPGILKSNPNRPNNVRMKREEFAKSAPIVIGVHRNSNDTLHTESVAEKDYEEYDESTSNDPKQSAYGSKATPVKLERNVNDLENMYDDSNKRYEENKRKYSVYSIGHSALWYSAKVQLFEKQSRPDGSTVWSDVTGGSPVSVGSLQPEVQDETGAASVSLRYRASDCLRSDQLLIPVPHSLLLLVPRPTSMKEKYQNGAGDFLVAPASTLAESKQLWTKSSGLENSHHFPDDYEKISHLLRVARPLHSVYPRGVASGNKLAHELVRLHGEDFLALLHPRTHHAQLDLEARADDNEIITSETSARVSSIVVDASRQHRTVIQVQVGNTGLISGDFRVTITDCPASMNELTAAVCSPATLIPPHHTRRVKLELDGAIPESASCSVSVLSAKDEVAAIRAFTIKRNDRCFCIWHCKCVCIEQSPHLPCQQLPPEQLAAAGLTGDDSPRRVRAVCYSDSRALDALLLLVGLLLILLLAGIVKGIMGLMCTRIGVCGLERLVELPRPLEEYYEPWLRHRRPVLYDCMGWPIHPDTKRRSVRVMSLTTQLCLNSVFFLTFPCALLWTLVWLMASRLCPSWTERCQSPTAPCYAWTQRAHVSNDRRRDDRGFGFAPAPRRDTAAPAHVAGPFITELDDTAEESDTNYVLDQMQKSKESLARNGPHSTTSGGRALR